MAYQNPDALKDLQQAQSDLSSITSDLQIFTQDPLTLPPDTTDTVLSAADGSIMGSSDFSSPLSFEPLGIVINSAGHIRSGQSKYNTGKGWWIGSDNNTAKLSIGDPTTRSLTWDGSNLTINGYVQSGIGAFGGDGSDGALSITSGTTTINLGGLTNVTKNYTSISISAGATLAFSNPHTNGTVIMLKSQGAITIAGTVNLQGAGASGGASVNQSFSGSTGFTNGNTGSNGFTHTTYFQNTNAGGAGRRAVDGGPGAGGATPTLALNTAYYTNIFNYAFKYSNLWTAAGGGSGSVQGTSTSGDYTSGAGGQAAGTILVECAGAWNFTGAFNGAGNNGGDATINSNGTQLGAGGGGGGGGALIFVLYNTLTANSGTYTVTGGTGGLGKGGTSTNQNNGGGGGGGTLVTAGSAGSALVSGANFSGQTGGNGAAGIAFVAKNNLYA